jgi:hypothetical protein
MTSLSLYEMTDYRYVERDRIKEEALASKGITLITVPCWWDKTRESLIASIRQKRSDLLEEYARLPIPPIPSHPPSDFFETTAVQIPDTRELMLPIIVSTKEFNPINWWMTENCAGLRICWHPYRQVIYSLHGKLVGVDGLISALMPQLYLDGKIWLGKKSPLGALFADSTTKLNLMIFRLIVIDLPGVGFTETLESSFCILTSYVHASHPFLVTATYVRCDGLRRIL